MTSRIVSETDGITEELIFHGDGSWALKRSEDVEPVIDANKRAQNNGEGWSPTREWRHVARIPMTVYLGWLTTYGVDPFDHGNEALLDRLLNDPDNRYLRVSTGSV